MPSIDPIALAIDLIRCPSVTPKSAGCFEIIEAVLQPLGFSCTRVPFEEVENFWAVREGAPGAPHLCFVGHVDVVPAINPHLWRYGPFEGAVQEGRLWGRGAVDMKGAIACFLSACQAILPQKRDVTVSFLLTSDEEGPAQHGTRQMVPWLEAHARPVTLFLVGEPTAKAQIGDTLKVGRRGSLTGTLTCHGRAGHIAYPEAFDNPLARLLPLGAWLMGQELDQGDAVFEPSRIEVTSVETGNLVSNITPSTAALRFGLRYNVLQEGAALEAWLRREIAARAGAHALEIQQNGEPFVTRDRHWISWMEDLLRGFVGEPPCVDARGGTTDGRFLSRHAPVLECGLKEATMHQVDECVEIDDLAALTSLYQEILESFPGAARTGTARMG